ncbi:protein o-linked-mannose beta-12-n-acetylglucosaminyltransferase 1/alpha-13-mannosyl-glycoprotein 2-beta-n-acetylglucosaminyltransferase [Anaeramoeba ignava]|uniref:Protein o-linked-mannose beta-12-n-acetylglucosaminyltransferase 1/alpha-13-mannosyl-glycoprotein 2-beta-n-acetylglucosaminyltransferase n=1 Tax=Anaeramoeba ignava TaxID=1746090 RepID=A0A9Q0L7V7_ANAIG|nr:protein o-linked-mannose beta-12-n-acetylglucosaminyltransferase 1/alpha-13-mannosyl-glycoprotein 2-beta-n-acetylglucosaminyltransferase [Anaeramoeba ignava]
MNENDNENFRNRITSKTKEKEKEILIENDINFGDKTQKTFQIKNENKIKTLFKIFGIIIGIILGTILLSKIICFGLDKIEYNSAFNKLKSYKTKTRELLPILMPTYGREKYLNQVLNKLGNLTNLDQVMIIFSQDGNNEEIAKLIDNFIENHPKIPMHLHSDSVVVLEDDLLPSEDFIQYFIWVRENIFKPQNKFIHDPFAIPKETLPTTHSQMIDNAKTQEFKRFFVEENPENQKLNLDLFLDRIFTVNGFKKNSAKSSSPYELDFAHFTVWGWGCSAARWKLIKMGWTWFANWDIQLQLTRKSYQLFSLSPRISRVRNIGMQGINFNEKDGDPRWDTYISETPIDYEDQFPILNNKICNTD